MAFNGSRLLGQGLSPQPQINPSRRRNPFDFNNFIVMYKAQNKEQFSFLILRTWHWKVSPPPPVSLFLLQHMSSGPKI